MRFGAADVALYGPAIKKLIPPGPTDPRITPRVLIFHVAVSEQPSLHDYFNGPSGGVESHFYVRRDGTVEQYRDTAWQADANTDANDFAISVETQGMEYGEWTPQQVAALKALALWCHKTHGIPLAKVKTWNGSGVGYHTQFPGSWDKRGATCPGPDRIRQFNNVLVPWLATGGNEDVVTPEDIKAIAAAVWATPVPRPGNTPASAGSQLGGANINSYRALKAAVDVPKLAAAVAAAVNPTINVDELAKAIVVELGKD